MSEPRPILRVNLPAGQNPAFLIRWRGKQEGPFTISVIEEKLAANQIGLLHEILRDSQWMTLRDYFAERDAALIAEQRSKQERQAHEKIEREAEEKEELRRISLAAETNCNIQSPTVGQSSSFTRSTATLYRLLLKTVCLVSLIAFFLPNVTISLPIVGKIEVSMFDFVASKSDHSKPSVEKPQKPSVENLTDLKVSKLTPGEVICLISLFGLLIHYLITVVWGVLTFIFAKTLSALNLAWLCLGLQFPILFSIGVHMILPNIKKDIIQQPGISDSDAMGTLLGIAFVNNMSISPGMIMWILMGLALVTVGLNTLQHSSRA